MYLAHRIGGPGTQPPLVIMRKKLSFVDGHVHLDGAFAFATLARQTKIERGFHFLTLPTVANCLAADHLAQQPRAPARGMLLFHGDHVTRTHRPALMLPANARADTTFGGRGEAVM